MSSIRVVLTIIAVLIWCDAAAADDWASKVTPRGWLPSGEFVVEIDNGAAVTWGGGADKFFGVCAPREFDKDGAIERACKLCGKGAADPVAACGAKPGKPPATQLRSPDKRVTLTKSVRCSMTGHDLDVRRCVTTIAVDRLGSVDRDDETTFGGKQSKVASWFRPDSSAVFVHFVGLFDTFWVIDVGEITARDKVKGAVTALIDLQRRSLRGEQNVSAVYASDATFFTDDPARGALAAAELPAAIGAAADLAIDAIEIEPSYDGFAAWVMFRVTTAGRSYRASELAMKTGATWTFAAGMFSRGIADADANTRARGGLAAGVEVARVRQDLPGEISALGSILRDGDPELTKKISKRPRTMLIGTAPTKRRLGGIAPAWKGWLAGGIQGKWVRGGLTTRGSTGWLTANLQVKKPGYTIPVRVFVIVDRTAARAVSEIVMSHAAVSY